jgi:hypothetical protein
VLAKGRYIGVAAAEPQTVDANKGPFIKNIM